MTTHTIEIRANGGPGYYLRVDGVCEAYCVTRWGAAWCARRIRARLRRRLLINIVWVGP